MSASITTVTTPAVDTPIVIDGEILRIVSISGRWVRLSNGRSISRAAAAEAAAEYAEDAELLGDELGDELEGEGMGPAPADEADDEAEEAEEAEEADDGRSIVRERYRAAYFKTRTDGVRNVDCGDEFAHALRGIRVGQIEAACRAGMFDDIASRWSALNPGQRSMNMRNALRRMWRDGSLDIGAFASLARSMPE